MSEQRPVTIRLLGALHTARRQQGLPTEVAVAVPPDGRSAREVARDLDLALEKIEAVFCNHVTYDLDHLLRPGDQVAFVPRGTPGPHRYFLGIYRAGTHEGRTGSAPDSR